MSTEDKKRTSLTGVHTVNAFKGKEEFQKEAIGDALRHTNKDKENAFKNAKSAIEETFGIEIPTENNVSDTSTDVDKEAVKNFLKAGLQKLQWLSYEGSLIVSALIGVSENEIKTIKLVQLPECDRIILQEQIDIPNASSLVVDFDKYKNFVFRIDGFSKQEFIFGNRVVSIPPEESTRYGKGDDVNVEQKGKEILIGDRIKLDKGRIQNLVQKPDSLYHPHTETQSTKEFQSRPKVSGRNAYEIRADIIENAIEILRISNNKTGLDYTSLTDGVLEIAEKLYDFVKHK